MDSAPNYSSIILSPPFTFLVGPRHTKLTIQSGLAQHVSKPLHDLMNNGRSRESKHRIAVLEEEDVETFAAFCEYAYTGDYNVPAPPEPPKEYKSDAVESALSPRNSWRGTFRSDSISSAIPPPAPSPPPERTESAEQKTNAPNEHEHEPVPAPEPETTPVMEEKAPSEAGEGKDATEYENADVERPAVLDQQHDTVTSTQENGEHKTKEEQVPTEPVEESGDWGDWAENAAASKLKKNKKSKNKKKKQEQLLADEPPVNLTPPSTPPPDRPAGDNEEMPVETAPEEPVEAGNGPEATEAMPKDEPSVTESAVEDWAQPASWAPREEEVPHEEKAWTEGKEEDEKRQEEPAAPPKPVLDMSFAQQQGSPPHEPGLDLWEEFIALQYDAPAVSTRSPVQEDAPSSEANLPYLTFHAKVYVFATRYLIPALAQLCLRKLHRDLLQLSFTESGVTTPCPESQYLSGLAARKGRLVLHLLQYAYTKTARLEPISPTSATQLRENELRRLVVHYAACQVKELSRYHSSGDSETATPSVRPMDAKDERAEDFGPKSLRALLDMTTELASDLVYRMM